MGGEIFGALFAIIDIAAFVLLVAALWRIFTKAGVDGWKAIILIYNIFILSKISRNERFAWIMLIVCAVYVAIYCGILAVFGDEIWCEAIQAKYNRLPRLAKASLAMTEW